jgi:hypothetical protein
MADTPGTDRDLHVAITAQALGPAAMFYSVLC